MKRTARILFVLFTAFYLVHPSFATTYFPTTNIPPFSGSTNISSTTYSNHYLKIDGSYAAWTGCDPKLYPDINCEVNTGKQVYYWDGQTTHQVTNYSDGQLPGEPQILSLSDGIIEWSFYGQQPSNLERYRIPNYVQQFPEQSTFTASTDGTDVFINDSGNIKKISEHPVGSGPVQVKQSGNYVVWTQRVGSKADIYFYDHILDTVYYLGSLIFDDFYIFNNHLYFQRTVDLEWIYYNRYLLTDPVKADAGQDQKVAKNSLVTLDGSSSSIKTGNIYYQWVQNNGPTVTLSDSSAVQPTFISPNVSVNTDLSFTLTVGINGSTVQSTDSVNITVLKTTPPNANAGNDVKARAGEEVILNGNGSNDPDGTIAKYKWMSYEGKNENGGDVYSKLCEGTSSICKTKAKGFAEQLVMLEVTDNEGARSTDTLSIINKLVGSGPVCGNSQIETGEVCDSNTQSCTIGGYSGTMTCNSQCTGFNTCTTTQFCGDGIKNGTEQCDGTSGVGAGQTCNAQCQLVTSGTFDLTLQAINMPTKTAGGTWDNVTWVLWSNGYVAQNVNFPTTGTYTFKIIANGMLAGSEPPKMELRIDQVVKATFNVSATSLTTYQASVNITTTGNHQVAVAFTNDFYGGTGQDRNLVVKSVQITK